jgi:hypothetical protein
VPRVVDAIEAVARRVEVHAFDEFKVPQSLGDLQGISGLRVNNLEAYDAQVLRVCNSAA